ncbi:MAG: single-stranded DNA-binding protein [Anaerolineales bacterium]|nr:single-stranded DNA-binding protein [Anaerolineales bacterium]
MYQQITIVGNLGKDPEMRYTTRRFRSPRLALAVTRNWTNHEGERQEKTIWFRVVAWRKLAETASQYLTKGSKVLVVGQVEEPTTFTDREGKVRASSK